MDMWYFGIEIPRPRHRRLSDRFYVSCAVAVPISAKKYEVDFTSSRLSIPSPHLRQFYRPWIHQESLAKTMRIVMIVGRNPELRRLRGYSPRHAGVAPMVKVNRSLSGSESV